MQTHTIGIDHGKTTFHLVALSEHIRVVIKFERSQVNSELLLLKATGIKRRTIPDPPVHFKGCQTMHGESTNKYTFKWNITPAIESEYVVKVSLFEVVARGDMLTLTATADAADEQRLREQADELAHNLARGLSYEYGERFEVAFGGESAVFHTGQQRVTGSFRVRVKEALAMFPWPVSYFTMAMAERLAISAKAGRWPVADMGSGSSYAKPVWAT